MFRAFLDTCVLVPSLQRDFLLQLATEGCFAPLWGTGVLEELGYVLPVLYTRRGLDDAVARSRSARLISQMESAFPGATIAAPKASYPYALADPDDAHIAHGAIFGGADAIVTDDRRAGLSANAALMNAAIEVLKAPDFVANTVAAHPQQARDSLLVMSSRFESPPMSPLRILQTLRDQYGFAEAFELLADEL
ncbi:PIN domain-containing protein [Microbacterium sp. HMH0099]|uniref:PIN domain-containing protein n=1 Tax=Microbacterium sp. HMH0099 TaxID=3414026 RepID=UPI003BF73D11